MRRIVFSKRASRRLDKLLEYLESEWSEKEKNNFIKKLDKTFSQIRKLPETAPKSDLINGLHKIVVTKQTTIYYKFDSKTITVFTLFDNRMNPDKLKGEIE